jgi:hypothetical protein
MPNYPPTKLLPFATIEPNITNSFGHFLWFFAKNETKSEKMKLKYFLKDSITKIENNSNFFQIYNVCQH